MLYKKEKTNTSKILNICVFIAVFFASMLGAQIAGISLNKLCLIPLLVFAVVKANIRRVKFGEEKKLLVLFYLFAIVSSLFNLNGQYDYIGYEDSLAFNIIQSVFIYIPLILFCTGYDLLDKYRKYAVIVARIQAIWGILQFFFWQSLKIDINDVVFNSFFHGFLGKNWTSWFNDTRNINIRVTGLNLDPAFFSLILVIGFCFEWNRIWKLIYFIAVSLAFSRSGMAAILVISIIEIITTHKEVTWKKLVKFIIAFVVVLVCLYILYSRVYSFQYQINTALNRFTELQTGSNGTKRHLNYISDAFNVWATRYDLIRKLIGIGPRNGGVGFSANNIYTFTGNNTWAVECDIAEILLGNGIIGFGLALFWYFFSFAHSNDKNIRHCIIALFLFGFMYDVFQSTIVQLLFIALCCSPEAYEKNNS